MLGAYMFGVVGVLAALALAVVVATDAGWIEEVRLRVQTIRMPALPSFDIESQPRGASAKRADVPGASAGGILDSLVGFARHSAEFSTRSFQRHEGITRGVVGGLSSDPAPD